RSQFADDPEMADLVEMFVSEMPERVEALQQAWQSGQVRDLTRLAHQLSGACAGYGFPSLGRAARELERQLTSMEEEAVEQLDRVRREYDCLIEMCSLACRDQPQA